MMGVNLGRRWLVVATSFLLVLICVTGVTSNHQRDEDYYKILGVPRSADTSQIRKGFKKMSLKYHPDKNEQNNETAEEQFRNVVAAYEVLKDPKKRMVYDTQGQAGFKHGGGGGGNRERGGHNHKSHENFFHQFHQQQQHKKKARVELFSQSDVYELEIGSLSKFLRRREVWVLLFYKSNHPQSLELKQIYRDLASKYYGILKVAAVDCVEEEELCSDQFEISSAETPSIVVFEADIRSKGHTYEGVLYDIQKIANFAVGFMESYVRKLNEKSYEVFASQNQQQKMYKVLLFTSKTSTPPLLRALSKEYNDKLDFGEIKDSETELVSAFNVTVYPTLLVVTDTETFENVKYEGEYKKDQIGKFLREFAYSTAQGSRGGKYIASNTVRLLTPDIVKNPANCGLSDLKLCVVLITSNELFSAEEAETLLNHSIIQLADREKIRFYHIPQRMLLMENVFDNEDFPSFPALVVVKGKRRRFARLAHDGGQFNATIVRNFLEDVIGGGGSFKAMHDTLKGNIFCVVISEEL